MLLRIGILLSVLCLVVGLYIRNTSQKENIPDQNRWDIESIDTMKFSRDLAREKGEDVDFEKEIQWQVEAIALSGATHIAIGTPYDEEFVPFLKKWVKSARAHNLHVWFRGNMSGWEGWFDYPRIDRTQHTKMVLSFIENNPDLFEDGDLFSSCPECENGGPGDPRKTGDVQGHREFLIKEYRETQKAFLSMNKLVMTNVNGMNYDVAQLIMDRETTRSLGNVVVVDHYVISPEQTIHDLSDIALSSGGLVILGEVGAPIPDIHGDMTDEQQKKWLETLLALASKEDSILGINYWTALGASTELWTADKNPRKAMFVLQRYYTKNHPAK